LRTAKNIFAEGFGDEVMRSVDFQSWRDLLRYIGQKLESRKESRLLLCFIFCAESRI